MKAKKLFPDLSITRIWNKINNFDNMNKIIHTTYSSEQLTHVINFIKRNGIIQVIHGGDTNTAIPVGNMGTLCTVDNSMIPKIMGRCMVSSNSDIKVQITVNQDGTVTGYNYGSQIPAGTMFRINMCYIAQD